jgi:hypothetical protein
MSWKHTAGFTLAMSMLLYISGIGIKNIIRYNDFRIRYTRVTQQLAYETQRKQEYLYTMRDMSKASFWEVKAKERLNYKVKGETVYKVKGMKSNL